MSSGNWLDELEAQLEVQLDAFLRSNPQQQALLEEQHRRDCQERLLAQRLKLRQEAEHQRQGLLGLAGEIRQWQERVRRARAAGAEDLAGRAEAHISTLMERGRNRWQNLGELGERFETVERELTDLGAAAATPPRAAAAGAPAAADGGARGATREGKAPGGVDLETAWNRFEAEQELDQLRRRQRT
jgi:hercynine metabolism protein